MCCKLNLFLSCSKDNPEAYRIDPIQKLFCSNFLLIFRLFTKCKFIKQNKRKTSRDFRKDAKRLDTRKCKSTLEKSCDKISNLSLPLFTNPLSHHRTLHPHHHLLIILELLPRPSLCRLH